MTGSPHALMPNYLRLFALFGIVVVNVQYIAFSALYSFADQGGETGAGRDHLVAGERAGALEDLWALLLHVRSGPRVPLPSTAFGVFRHPF
ncbi:hypothetical protein K1W69_00080 [Hoeflea sp. WL0058]|uniref:Uncharacterized protein n=1 Tax=Flavimaribacter sediminis TaxID=2865987 RepID=A0AAE2ZIG6_9HYPH|nr:hypothetical protein [Flavimaribacter sediminis]MBW8635566.1 hypothetical protein [Flavimaribacter sediminis]